MYKGLTPCLIQTIPHNGISLSIYETMKHGMLILSISLDSICNVSIVEMIKRKYFPEHPGVLQLFSCTSTATIVSTYPIWHTTTNNLKLIANNRSVCDLSVARCDGQIGNGRNCR